MALPAFLSNALEFLARPAADNERELALYTTPPKVSNLKPDDPFATTARLDTIHTARALYSRDGRYRAVIDKYVSDIVRAGFAFESDVVQSERMQELSHDYALETQLSEWLRDLFLSGDLFLQTMVDGNRITGWFPLPATHMRRNSNAYDAFENPDAAYTLLRTQEVVVDSQEYQNTSNDSAFSADEVVHVRWGRASGSDKYGSPLLGSAHAALQRAIRAESNLDVRRAVHGSFRLWHKLGDSHVPPSPEQLKDYMVAAEEDAGDLSSPMKAYYTGTDVDISVLPGDSNLHEYGDAQWQLEAFWAGCPVPKAVLGYADNLNRDIFQVQAQEYEARLETASEFVSQHILSPVMAIILLQEGVTVFPSEISATFGSRHVFSPSNFKLLAEALQKLPSGVLSREDATRLLASEMDVDSDELIASAEAEYATISSTMNNEPTDLTTDTQET